MGPFVAFLVQCAADCVEATGQGRLSGSTTKRLLPGSSTRDNSPEGEAASRGTAEAKSQEPCPDCEGRGWVNTYTGDERGPLRAVDFLPETCMACLGTGRL